MQATLPQLSGARPFEWLLAVLLALFLHASFVVFYQNPERPKGAQKSGAGGIEVGLKHIRPAPAKAAEDPAQQRRKPETPTVPKKKLQAVEPAKPKPAITPKPKPIVKTVARPTPKPTPVKKAVPKPTKKEKVKIETVTPQVERETKVVADPIPPAPQTDNKPQESSATLDAKSTIEDTPGSQQTMSDYSAPKEESAAGGGAPGATIDYQTALQIWLERHKRYPRAAKRRGQQDLVELEFVIDAEGKLLSHKIVNASRYASLNRAVEKMIRKADPLPPVPKSIRGGNAQFTFVVPIVFRLD